MPVDPAMDPPLFQVESRCGNARRGVLTTAHGVVQTPAFMPVGTLGAVKGITPDRLEELGAEMMLANLYHLALRPGVDAIERMGGFHEFAGWSRPVLTDSGGYQVFSLAALRSVDSEGVTFRNHVDGAEMRLTPESVVDSQRRLGVDIAMVLDECPPWPVDRAEASSSWERTLGWAQRSRQVWESEGSGRQVLFGIVQGSAYRDLRERAVNDLTALDFPGYAIGGVSVGEPGEDRRAVVEWVGPALPDERPRYLMGVGTPSDIAHAVLHGVDLFDCVLPSRNARHGVLFTDEGVVRIKNARYREDSTPLLCGVSRAFLHHLFRSGEITAKVLATAHNLRFYLDFMGRLRDAIAARTLGDFVTDVRSVYDPESGLSEQRSSRANSPESLA